MSLIIDLTSCGKISSNINQQFHTNGPELMETTTCTWVEPTLSAILVVQEYSDGSVDKHASMTMTGLEEYNTLPLNDQPAIYYVYYDHVGMLRQGSLVGDNTVCQHQFYDYQ